MNEEQLKALGLDAETVTKVLKMHKDSIDGNYVPKATFESEREKVKTLNTQITERDNQIAELGKFKGTADDLQKQVDDYKKQNDELKANSEKELNKLRQENILKFELKDQVIDVDDVLPKLKLENIVFEDDKIKSGLKEQLDDLRKSKPHYFNQNTGDGKNNNNGFKIFGDTPKDSNNGNNNTDSAEVSLARELANARIASLEASKKASEVYFK